ncbi:MAG: hypothetical protein SFW09_17255 [Hyphomicrobiaceae bacterium]|nr:hypothetical protein [Hyphomicrobiaceae bacterium]
MDLQTSSDGPAPVEALADAVQTATDRTVEPVADKKGPMPPAEPKAPQHVVDEIRTKIAAAHAMAVGGSRREAVDLFHEIRCFADRGPLAEVVGKLVAEFSATNEAERNKFNAFVRQGSPANATRRAILFSDSLGLPRPRQPLGAIGNRATSYAFALRENLKRSARNNSNPAFRIEPWCQRYATSENVLSWIDGIDFTDANVFVHVGLNDFSRRIFTERQRISMKLLPPDLVREIVRFSQANHYRWDIINQYDDYCYVSIDRWRRNIAEVAAGVGRKGARSVTWFTIVQLPLAVETHTPHYRFNVTRYNGALYEAQKDRLLRVYDLDRVAWENGINKVMLDDLMHISLDGHAIIGRGLADYVR